MLLLSLFLIGFLFILAGGVGAAQKLGFLKAALSKITAWSALSAVLVTFETGHLYAFLSYSWVFIFLAVFVYGSVYLARWSNGS